MLSELCEQRTGNRCCDRFTNSRHHRGVCLSQFRGRELPDRTLTAVMNRQAVLRCGGSRLQRQMLPQPLKHLLGLSCHKHHSAKGDPPRQSTILHVTDSLSRQLRRQQHGLHSRQRPRMDRQLPRGNGGQFLHATQSGEVCFRSWLSAGSGQPIQLCGLREHLAWRQQKSAAAVFHKQPWMSVQCGCSSGFSGNDKLPRPEHGV